MRMIYVKRMQVTYKNLKWWFRSVIVIILVGIFTIEWMTMSQALIGTVTSASLSRAWMYTAMVESSQNDPRLGLGLINPPLTLGSI